MDAAWHGSGGMASLEVMLVIPSPVYKQTRCGGTLFSWALSL